MNLLIAHRGESYLAPENTLAAINLAWAQGAEAVEFDVRLTRDGRLVASHDADTQRTGGQALRIAEQTLERLRQLDVGRWKDPRWTGERMPSLEQVLATAPPRGRLFIEIKDGPECVSPLADALRSTRTDLAQCVIISFHAEVISAVRKVSPGLEACWLAAQSREETTGRWTPDLDQIIATARAIQAHGVDLAARDPIDAAAVAKLRQAGLKVYVWTVDDPAHARRLLAAGVDGVTTNRPAWMAEQLKVMS